MKVILNVSGNRTKKRTGKKFILVKLKQFASDIILLPANVKNWRLFVILLTLNLIISWIFQEYVMTKEVYHSILSERLEDYRIDQQIELVNRFEILGYFLLPIALWLKFSFVALLLQLPLMLKFIEIPFSKIYRAVMVASVSSVLMSAVRLGQLILTPVSQINESVLKITPLSLGSIIDAARYPDSAITILSAFNLFEAFWLVLLMLGFVSIAKEKLKKIDILLLISGVWIFLLVLQYALVTYMEKTFG
jgi:hypothetical protein